MKMNVGMRLAWFSAPLPHASLLHRQGKTVVIVTLSDEVAKRAQRIIRVKDGLVEHNLHFETKM